MSEENTALAEDSNPPEEAGFFVPDDQGHEPEENIEPERDFEAEAREMGWSPKDNWRGDPEKWVDAEEFVTRGETFIPFLKASNKKLEEQLKQKDEETAKRFAKLEKVTQAGLEALKKQYAQEVSELTVKIGQAAKNEDWDTFNELTKQRDEKIKKEPGEDKPDAEDPQEVQSEWVSRNSWFNSNFEMNAKAINYSQFLAQQKPDITLKENLEQTEAYMRQQHPELFGAASQQRQASANGHALVDGGSQVTVPGKGKPGVLSGIPREDLDVGRRQVAEGLFKSIEDWAKEYKDA